MNCTACGSITKSMGTVPFDKNLFDIPIVDTTPIEYVQCVSCHSIFFKNKSFTC